MNILITTFVFLLGTIIGSFLNVVIYRFNTGKTIVRGRSVCMSCGHNLSWYELIPVLSFLIQKGRCKACSSKISYQYPFVEFITAFVFSALAWHFLPILDYSVKLYIFALVFSMLIFSLFIVIAVYDIRHKIVPDKLVYTVAVLALFSAFFNLSGSGSLIAKPYMLQIYAGPLLALPFAMIWFFSKGRLMGLGDAKLILAIGWLMGISAGIAALILSFWIAAVFGIVMIIFSRMKIKMKTEIPFAPFLILGTFIVLLFNLNLLSLIQLFTF